MKHDPIVEEIHQIRQQLWAECRGELDQLLDRLQAAETQDHRRVVSWEAVLRPLRTYTGQRLTQEAFGSPQ